MASYTLSESDRQELLKLKAEVNALRGQVNRRRMPPYRNGAGDPDACIVRLDSTCAGGGKYSGVIMDPPSTLACASPDLAFPEGLTAGDTCLVSNVAEDGQGTHNLTADGSKYHNGVIMGKDADGNWLVNIEVGSGNCSPGTADLQVMTNTAYNSTDFIQTKKTYTFDFCAGTITEIATSDSVVFSTAPCDTDPTSLAEFYSF